MVDISNILKKQKEYYASHKTRNLKTRLSYLNKLEEVIKKHEKDILEALKRDLNKSSFEGYATEIGTVLEELRYMRRHLPLWVLPKRVRTSIANFPSTSKIYKDPYGVVLIMSPWNYPFMLAISPLIGAIAAGNCAIIKPSNYSPSTSRILEVICSEVFPKEYVAVIQGGREENKTLLEQKFDYIFFTGSVAVGKTVMEAASRHLTPVTLELGGKSPCIVDETANLDLAARRIIWGKFINSGQTCVAPDYVLVHHTVKDELIQNMKRYIMRFYGKDAGRNEEFPRIINEKHFKRLCSLLEGEKIIIGGVANEETLQIAPTILDRITWDSKIMEDEIFGPILPILEYQDLREEINRINNRPKPLALYFFTTNKGNERRVVRDISYGGGCINDTIMHLASSSLPFGGVGESGMGGYHGKASFDTFTHKKSILKKSNRIDIPLRYPPYKDKLALLKKIM